MPYCLSLGDAGRPQPVANSGSLLETGARRA
jgi:hypothetical protein